MYLRREASADTAAIRGLTGDSLADILDLVRNGNDWLPALSFVAVTADGQVIGHVAGTRGQVGTTPALALTGPAIHPDRRGQGIGTALMHTVLGAADALGVGGPNRHRHPGAAARLARESG